MAKKGRNDLYNSTNSRIYDNDNKEIKAVNVRDNFKDSIDSHFNLVDDQLKDLKYNGNQSLSSYLQSIAASAPIFGRIWYVNPGDESLGKTFSVDGIIASATVSDTVGGATRISVPLKQNIGNRKVIIQPAYDGSGNWKAESHIGGWVYRKISNTHIEIAVREVGSHQKLILEVMFI